MKYKGIELVEVTKDQIFDRPKLMLVWDESYGIPVQCEVCAIVSRTSEYRVICKNSTWKHCAEIPEPKPVTQRELARWLARGNGEVKFNPEFRNCYSQFSYVDRDADSPVPKSYTVRKYEDTEWHFVTREYLGLDGE